MNGRKQVYYGWYVVGNEDAAFAVVGEKIHYFTRDLDVNNDAFIRALGWCFNNPADLETKIEEIGEG